MTRNAGVVDGTRTLTLLRLCCSFTKSPVLFRLDFSEEPVLEMVLRLTLE